MAWNYMEAVSAPRKVRDFNLPYTLKYDDDAGTTIAIFIGSSPEAAQANELSRQSLLEVPTEVDPNFNSTNPVN